MISYYKGNLLDSGCDIIAHQVNLQGVMGGGLAKQIAQKYPKCEEQYKRWCTCKNFSKEKLLGDGIIVKIAEHKFIENCFTQDENFNTDYNAVRKCFIYLYNLCKFQGFKTIGVPKNYGCGIAHGDWQKVEQIFKDIFENEPKIDFQIWELI